MMKILVLALLTIVSSVFGQQINEYLVLPGKNCSQDSPCMDPHARCNPIGQCQCNFNFYPVTYFKDDPNPACMFFGCYIDADCPHFYGPNSFCTHEHGCVCKQGFKVNQLTQMCTDPDTH